MSGLVGWVDRRRDLRGEAEVVSAMTEAVRRRGPDGKGVWLSPGAAMGHRRLAATDGWGEQPAVTETDRGPVVLAYDGHIDNLPELRRELAGRGARFDTGDDTDVLGQAYLMWGAGFTERLDGMFAVAVWDGRTSTLVLGRDRLGLKPLYYATYADGVLFASEPKGILANPLFQPRLDLAALPIVLQPRLTRPGETPLVGLREVPPAQVITVTAERVAAHEYWRLTSTPHTESFADTAAHVRALLDDVVARQVPGSGACAAMLSGGVDSTSVTALAARQLGGERALDTYCVEFETDPAHFVATELRPDVDSPYAAAAAEFLGTRHHRVTATMADLLAAIPGTRQARDLPGWGQFDASMYLLFQRMRDQAAIAFSGEAADEFFGGYPYFFKPELVRRQHFPWLGDGPKLSDCLSPDVLAVVDPVADERDRYAELIARVPRLDGEDAEEARMREVLFLGMAGPLQVILDRKERMSMAHGLQVRLPFCDHRLVQYVWNVPWRMKSEGGLKGLLKAAMADMLPGSTLNRQKSAYPHVHNPEHENQILDAVERIAADTTSPLAGIFDPARLTAMVSRIRSNQVGSMLPGGASGAQLFIQLVELRAWLDDYKVAVSQ